MSRPASRFRRPPIAALVTALVFASSAAPQAAEAAMALTVQLQPQQASVVVGQPLAINVYLRALTDTNVAAPAKLGSVDFDFGGVTNATTPVRFVATTNAPKAFVADTGFAATLPLVFDGSLVDGHTFSDLSFSVGNGDFTGGLATNAGTDVLVGTLYVTATTPGAYTLSANNTGSGFTANDDNGTAFTPTYLNAAFTAVQAPEPATLGIIGVAAAGALARRRTRSAV